jgi:diadenosine tetraphosphate (Ap4A) HIT family hydrolase
MTSGACVLCVRADALDAAEAGWLLRTECWGVSMYPSAAVPGWVAVQTTRHTEGLKDLNHPEAAELGPLLSRVSAAVTLVTGSEHVYTYSLGEACPHTHILVGPPQRELRGKAFIAALLDRDKSVVDQATTDLTAIGLASELSGRRGPAHPPYRRMPVHHPKGDIT